MKLSAVKEDIMLYRLCWCFIVFLYHSCVNVSVWCFVYNSLSLRIVWRIVKLFKNVSKSCLVSCQCVTPLAPCVVFIEVFSVSEWCVWVLELLTRFDGSFNTMCCVMFSQQCCVGAAGGRPGRLRERSLLFQRCAAAH